jgi:hypothetical protein
MIEVREIAQAAAPSPRAPCVLEVEENRSGVPHHDIPVVKVSVDESSRVELGDARTKQGEQTVSLLGPRAQGVFEREPVHVALHEQAVSVFKAGQGERLRHGNPGGAERAQGAPLAHGRRATDTLLQRLAQGVTPRAEAKLLYEQDPPSGGGEPDQAAAGIVAEYLRTRPRRTGGFCAQPRFDLGTHGELTRLPARPRAQRRTRA